MSCVEIYTKYKLWIFFFLYVFTLERTTAQSDELGRVNVTSHGHHVCSCKHFDCSCCGHIEWDEVHLNATICTYAAYLDQDYGISFGITYNGKLIINETISARNPPPICIGENIIENLQADICVRLYDIEVNRTFFHGCFEIEFKLAKLNIYPIKLGCFHSVNHNPSSSITLWSHTFFTKHLYFFIFAILLPNVVFY